MNRIGSTCLVGATMALAAVAFPASGSAQTFSACRVPGVGAIYMVAVPGAPAACLDASHVAFSWTEGGAPGPGSVTTAMLADGAVTTAKIADGTIATGDVADGAIGAAKLSATAVSNGHLGTGTANAATVLRGDRSWVRAEKVTRLEYSGEVSAVSADPAVLFRTIGVFTKDNAATGITVNWHSHVGIGAGPGPFCEWEVRIDGTNPTGSTAFWGSIVYAPQQAVSLDAYWSGLSAGAHTVSIWLRGFGNTCSENLVNFRPSVLVFER